MRTQHHDCNECWRIMVIEFEIKNPLDKLYIRIVNDATVGR